MLCLSRLQNQDCSFSVSRRTNLRMEGQQLSTYGSIYFLPLGQKHDLYGLISIIQFGLRILDLKTPSYESIPVVCEFQKVFPEDLHGVPPEREIDFEIYLLQDTHPVSIPPYRMSVTEHNKLREELKDLLDKHFIRHIISPWGTPVLFIKKKMVFLECALTIES